MKRWTGSWLAAIVSGTLVAFNAFTLTRLPQIQDLHLEFFLPALYALDRVLEQRPSARRRGARVLVRAAGAHGPVLDGVHVPVAAGRDARQTDRLDRRQVSCARAADGSLAAAIALAALIPFMLPYYHASETVGLGRSLEETARYSAELTDYLAAPGRIYFDWWGKRFFQGDALFPGVTALAPGGRWNRRGRLERSSGANDARVRARRLRALVRSGLSTVPVALSRLPAAHGHSRRGAIR